MSQYTAILLVCLAQIALASSDYGSNGNTDYQTKPQPSYGASNYGTNTHDTGYGSTGTGYPDRSGYPDRDRDDHRDTCRRLRDLHISGQTTHRASIHEFERKGRTYIKISCKNNKRPFALVTERDGQNTVFDTVTLQNTALLATGFNIDFVAQCHRHGRVVGEGVNGNRNTLRRVTCVQLSAPADPLTTL